MSVDRFPQSLPQTLLGWYDLNARALPWRLPPGAGRLPDPYPVWLSEVMAQQTRVQVAARYWGRFVTLWPTIDALAAAPDEDVMREWAGLGYYARARNLLAAARAIAANGEFPANAAAWRTLPGVGPYTAAAIAAIAFGEPVAAVDANVVRVMARLMMLDTPESLAPTRLARFLQPYVPVGRPGDFAQALMELGATVCLPRNPRCSECPLAKDCAARIAGEADRFPPKPQPKIHVVKQGLAWWITDGDAVALVRRPARGLLGGTLGLPGTPWSADEPHALPFDGDWQMLPTPVRHVFSHFTLNLAVASIRIQRRCPDLAGAPLIWTDRSAIGTAGLASLYLRAAEMVAADQTNRQETTST